MSRCDPANCSVSRRPNENPNPCTSPNANRVLVRVPLEAMQDFNFPQRGPGYLDIGAADSMLRDAIMVWVGNQFELYEEDVRLGDQRLAAVRVSLPSDKSFATYAEALAHVTGPPLSDDVDIVWQQAMVDALFEYTIRSDQSNFSINPRLARLGLRTITVLRFVLPGGAVRAFEYSGDPGLVRGSPPGRTRGPADPVRSTRSAAGPAPGRFR